MKIKQKEIIGSDNCRMRVTLEFDDEFKSYDILVEQSTERLPIGDKERYGKWRMCSSSPERTLELAEREFNRRIESIKKRGF